MRCRLDTPYSDTRAGSLSWHLGAPPRPALAALTLEVWEVKIEFRLLGSSHQVVATLGASSCSETVACDAGGAGLPPVTDRALPGLVYRFSSLVEQLPAERLSRRAESILESVGDDTSGLVGVFPGSPHALTAVRAEPRPGGVAWWTWHVYPQSGEVVVTASEVRRR